MQDRLIGKCLVIAMAIGFSSSMIAKTAEVKPEEVAKISEGLKSGNDKIFLDAVEAVLAKDQNHLESLNALGVYHVGKKNYGLARLIFGRALESHPKSAALYNNIGVVDLHEGDEKSAILRFSKARELRKDNEISGANLASIYLKYQDFQRSLSFLEDAHILTRKGLKSGDDNAVHIANNFAVALTGVGEPKTARKIYERIFEHESPKPEIYLNYTILLVDVLKDRKQALRAISKLRFLTDNRKILRELESLEKKVDNLK